MNLGIHGDIRALKEAIGTRRPVLADIMNKHGDKTLYEYAQDFLDVNPSPLLDMRKQELIDVLGDLLEGRLGKEVAANVARQLQKFPLVSTTDHHCPLSHPFWVNANIISALPYEARREPDLRSLVVFSFASVSLNNASGFSRGITFHADTESNELIRLPILPDKLKMSTVYGTRSFAHEDLDRARDVLAKMKREGKISPDRCSGVLSILDTHFSAPAVIESAHLCSQITRINRRFWPLLFHPPTEGGGCPERAPTCPERSRGKGESKGIAVPELVYLEIETLVAQLLNRRHLFSENSRLRTLLFDPSWQPLIREHFAGLPGAFAQDGAWGTYFFWGTDAKNHRVRLRLADGHLRSDDGCITLPFTPESVAASLKAKKIFPSMLLCYLTVALYYGMKCLGGFCQVHDLTVIKKAWQKILRAKGEHIEAEAIESVQTKELGGDGMVLAYLEMHNRNLTPATAIDMMLEQTDTGFGKYLSLSKTVTLSEAMNSLLPEMYTVLYSQKERDPALAGITPERILRESGTVEKLWSSRCGTQRQAVGLGK